MNGRIISLRGVQTHNLKQVDLDLDWGKLIVLCGVSGSGKTSLALDTLYAEGQRRYIESFSAYARRFLDRLEKPPADRIEGIPPSVAVTRRPPPKDSRTTVGAATEIADYLRVLFARAGEIFCFGCGQPIKRDTPDTIAIHLNSLPDEARFQIAFQLTGDEEVSLVERLETLAREGFGRFVVNGKTISLNDTAMLSDAVAWVIVDRLTGGVDEKRLRESVESAFQHGGGRCLVLSQPNDQSTAQRTIIDEREWLLERFSDQLECTQCEITLLDPEPNLFNFSSPLGACPVCEGEGFLFDYDIDAIVPNSEKTLAGGALAPFRAEGQQYNHDLILKAAASYGLSIEAPFTDVTDAQCDWLINGDGAFAGVRKLLDEQESKKRGRRSQTDQWKNDLPCPACGGARLRPEALAVRVNGVNFAEATARTAEHAIEYLATLSLTGEAAEIAGPLVAEAESRLRFLKSVGLGYLTLDRLLHTLSGGEAQRVALASSLGSSLVNMLYVLDEPAAGLHAVDCAQMIDALKRLRDRGNTVVVVEHSADVILAADTTIEIGPGAGDRGGEIVFEGTPAELMDDDASFTGEYLTGRRGVSSMGKRRDTNRGSIRLTGARGRNLKNVSVEFPLGMLCVVTGVSGAGKSTLVQDTLFPLLCRRLRIDSAKALPIDEIFGAGQVDHVTLVDQSPIGKSPRSSPVTYIKAFDEIRKVFAETVDARARNYAAGKFSFNVDGGRCDTCKGDGHIQVDMQFLADVFMKCPSCGGDRYRDEVLEVRYRGMSIADVLNMTVREAFSFFRGRSKVQARLKHLIDVGLDYLRLGQPANTLSSGEAQRLKLAASLGGKTRQRTLFLLDEPTTGLHFSDVVNLLDCFDALLSVGHSLIVIEHNLQLMMAADHIIDLGPGAAENGGEVVAAGTPEEVARVETSATGRCLAKAFARQAAFLDAQPSEE